MKSQSFQMKRCLVGVNLYRKFDLPFVLCYLIMLENAVVGQRKAYGWFKTRVKYAERAEDVDVVAKKLL